MNVNFFFKFLSCQQGVVMEEGGPEERASAIFKVNSQHFKLTMLTIR